MPRLLQINIAVFLWAGTAMFAKGIPLSAVHITAIRYLIASGTILLVLRACKRPVALRTGREYLVMVALGVLLGLNGLAIFQSLKVSSAAVALLSSYTYPPFAALLEPLLFKEKFKRLDLASAAVAFLGVFLMMPAFDLHHGTTQGVLLGMLAGLCVMLRSFVIRKFALALPLPSVVFWHMAVTGLLLAPWLFFQPARCTASAGGLLVLLGVCFTAVPQALYCASLKGLSARTVGVISTLQPLLAAGLGYLIYGETMDGRTLIGGGFILSCFVFEVFRRGERRAAPPAAVSTPSRRPQSSDRGYGPQRAGSSSRAAPGS